MKHLAQPLMAVCAIFHDVQALFGLQVWTYRLNHMERCVIASGRAADHKRKEGEDVHE